MIVRLQLGKGHRVNRKSGKNRHIAVVFGSLLVPIALMAYVLALWSLSADLGVTQEFALTGLFAHWQVWLAAGGLVQLAASFLNRYAESGRLHLPQVLAWLPHRR